MKNSIRYKFFPDKATTVNGTETGVVNRVDPDMRNEWVYYFLLHPHYATHLMGLINSMLNCSSSSRRRVLWNFPLIGKFKVIVTFRCQLRFNYQFQSLCSGFRDSNYHSPCLIINIDALPALVSPVIIIIIYHLTLSHYSSVCIDATLAFFNLAFRDSQICQLSKQQEFISSLLTAQLPCPWRTTN